MLMHASNLSVCLYGMDIDPLVCLISRVNGALYVPWLSFPFSAKILGTDAIPAPPPALLPVPPEALPAADVPVYRSDDRGQGLLFDLGAQKPKRAKKPQILFPQPVTL
jgi:hypothetical protein